MDDLRTEIRAAFEKEQVAHTIPGGLRSNLTAAAAAQTRPVRNLQWVAVAVAALLGLLVVAGLMSTRLGPRASVPGSAKATPVADYGPPPAGVQLVYVRDPNNSAWLIGFDWSGLAQATVKFSQPAQVSAAPDGSGFFYANGKGGQVQLFDRLGKPIGVTGASASFDYEVWADDSRHLCGLAYNAPTNQWLLTTRSAEDALHTVPLALDPTIVESGIIGVSIAACAVGSDQAIIVRAPTGGPAGAEIWVVRISNGKTLSRHTYQHGTVGTIVASSDGSYVALTQGPAVKTVNRLGAAQIVRVSDWRVVATPLAWNVRGFSGDDSLLLADQLQPDGFTQLVVLDWRSGTVLWRDQSTAALGTFLAQPGGRNFAVALVSAGSDPLATILVVPGDGSIPKFPGTYEPAW